MSRRGLFSLFALLFFVSGAAGLIYEVLWLRQFGLVMGTTALALSAVLTSFMSGLALGGWLGGRWADRAPKPLVLYGGLEIAIGLWAVAMPFLISLIAPVIAPLYQSNPNGFPLHAVRFSLAFVLMLVPTTFMGATLPALIRFFTASESEIGRRVGWLYGINTIGAMGGAALAGFLLIPLAGMRSTVWIAAAGNISVGIVALILSRSRDVLRAQDAITSPSASDEHPASSRAVTTTLAVIALSGVAAMIYQVCWTRMFALLLGSSTYAFSIVLTATIGGLALGALVFGPIADWVSFRLTLLAIIQFFIAAGALAIAGLAPEFPTLVLYIIRDFEQSYPKLLGAEFALVGGILFIPTFFMGGVFPVAARICARSMRDLGKEVGRAYSINTVGAVVGSFTAALVFMRFFGINGAMLIAVGMSLAAAAACALAEPDLPRSTKTILASAAVLAGILIIIAPPKWEREVMTGAPYSFKLMYRNPQITRQTVRQTLADWKLLYYRDGLAGTVSVHETEGSLGQRWLSVNGKADASNAPADMPTQITLGHLALFLHPSAKKVMVLGLGSGMTLQAVLKHSSVERVDIVEISSQVVEAVRLHFAEMNGHALDDPRVHLIVADGRNHLTLTGETYDVIINEPSNPWMAGIAQMFTKEFHELALQKLADDGVILQWMHFYTISRQDVMMVMRTFYSVLPYGSAWESTDRNIFFAGSRRPLKLDWPSYVAMIGDPAVRDNLNRCGLSKPAVFLTQFIASREHLVSLDSAGGELNLDDTCRLEFSAPRAYYDEARRIDVWEPYGWRESPAPIFNSASVPADIASWFDTIPAARRALKETFEFPPRGGACEMKSALARAASINPHDYATRDYLVRACDECANELANAGKIAEARKSLEEGIEAYESLRITYDLHQVAGLYERSRDLARKAGDEPAAKVWEERMKGFVQGAAKR